MAQRSQHCTVTIDLAGTNPLTSSEVDARRARTPLHFVLGALQFQLIAPPQKTVFIPEKADSCKIMQAEPFGCESTLISLLPEIGIQQRPTILACTANKPEGASRWLSQQNLSCQGMRSLITLQDPDNLLGRHNVITSIGRPEQQGIAAHELFRSSRHSNLAFRDLDRRCQVAHTISLQLFVNGQRPELHLAYETQQPLANAPRFLA
jgi:hypothetical protein